MVLAELCNECGNCMVFCPENGDPAKIKAKLYVDEARFDAGDGQGFLLKSAGTGVEVTARPGCDQEVPTLLDLLNDADQGLPIRHSDLPVAVDPA
jgi:putative selenate reductase